MVIYGFYHVWCINNYLEVFDKQISNIKNSGLLDKTKLLYIGVIGSTEDVTKLEKYLNENNITNYKLLYFGEDVLQFEFPTLDKIYELSFTEDFYCYYIHTKGVSYFIESDNLTKVKEYNTNEEAKQLLIKEYNWLNQKYPRDYPNTTDLNYMYNACTNTNENLEIWREYMEYFVINLHEKTIGKLDNGYLAVGTHMEGSNRWKHYRGNFWFSKSSHIRNLKKPSDFKYDSKFERRQAELWITSYELYHNFYFYHIPKLEKPIWVERLNNDYKDEKNWNTYQMLDEFYRPRYLPPDLPQLHLDLIKLRNLGIIK